MLLILAVGVIECAIDVLLRLAVGLIAVLVESRSVGVVECDVRVRLSEVILVALLGSKVILRLLVLDPTEVVTTVLGSLVTLLVLLIDPTEVVVALLGRTVTLPLLVLEPVEVLGTDTDTSIDVDVIDVLVGNLDEADVGTDLVVVIEFIVDVVVVVVALLDGMGSRGGLSARSF